MLRSDPGIRTEVPEPSAPLDVDLGSLAEEFSAEGRSPAAPFSANVASVDPKGAELPELLAPAASGSAALHFPPADVPPEPFPPVDEHLVQPEITRDEMIRGRRVIALPALEPHADKHVDLGFVIRAHIPEGYVGAADLITRLSQGSDFATDVCIRKEGTDPSTGRRYLEEVSFEIVNEQSMRDIREKAEDLIARGVRRVFAIFVKKRYVAEWSVKKGDFEALAPGGFINDQCFVRPISIRALLDAAEAENEVVRALRAKGNPVIRSIEQQSRDEGRRAVLIRQLRVRFGELPQEALTRLEDADAQTLDLWAERLLSANSLAELFGSA